MNEYDEYEICDTCNRLRHMDEMEDCIKNTKGFIKVCHYCLEDDIYLEEG